MAYGLAEFERRVKKICPRWYVRGGPILRLSDSQAKAVLRPIQVWEVPYAQGQGFQGHTLIMEVGDPDEYAETGEWPRLNPNHINSLRRGHWNRVRCKQLEEIQKVNKENERRKIRNAHQQSFINEQFARENRSAFRQATRGLGISKATLKDSGPRKFIYSAGV